MKKILFISIILLGFGLAILSPVHNAKAQQLQPAQISTTKDTAETPEPPPGAIVFDMKYRSLSGNKDELRYNSYCGFGQRECETPFIKILI